MATQGEIWQMARLLGQDEFLNCLALTTLDDLTKLDAEQLAKVQRCTFDNANRLTRALVHEAAGRDDITTPEAAATYLDHRLAALGDLITEDTRRLIREGFRALTVRWGSAA